MRLKLGRPNLTDYRRYFDQPPATSQSPLTVTWLPDHGFGLLRPTALVSEWLSAFNRGDVNALAQLYSADAVNDSLANSCVRGRAAIREMLAQRFVSTNLVRSVESLFEDGDWAILEWRAANGQRGCSLFCVKRGEIEQQREY